MNQVSPFGPTALDAASSEVRLGVELTLGELIAASRSVDQHSLIVEFATA